MNVTKKILNNGIRLITIPMKDTPNVAVSVFLDAGSAYEEKEKNGIFHLLEHSNFKGTSKRPSAFAITSEIEGIGGEINAYTGEDGMAYYIRSHGNHLEKALDVLSDIYLNSNFDLSEIEKEKSVVIQEIKRKEEKPSDEIFDMLNSLMYGDQSVGRGILGTEQSVGSIKNSDLVRHRDMYHVSSATIVVVAGNFDENNISNLVEEKFKLIPKNNKPEKPAVLKIDQTVPKIILKMKDAEQAHLLIGFRSFGTHDERQPAIEVISQALGGGLSSRLGQKLREEMGVCYEFNVHNAHYTDYGNFTIYAGVDVSRTEEVIKVILEEVKKIKDQPLSKEELDKISGYIDSFLLYMETPGALANFYGSREILKKDLITPEEFVKQFKNITAEYIQKVANDLFRNDLLNVAIIGPFNDEDHFLKILNI
ncbi:MAG: pitrilysin family protein [Candidatus Paceibacterota bacterium]